MTDETTGYVVPDLVIADSPYQTRATWDALTRTIVVRSDGEQITLVPGEVRALYEWMRLHELRG